MNTCILMAKIVSEPELRYTPDTQLPVTQMLIEIEGLGPNDPAATLKAVGWGNLATEIKERYQQGDQVIVTGRLGMRSLEVSPGTKEKRAELTISHIYPIVIANSVTDSTESAKTNVVELESFRPQVEPFSEETTIEPEVFSPTQEDHLDDIPF